MQRYYAVSLIRFFYIEGFQPHIIIDVELVRLRVRFYGIIEILFLLEVKKEKIHLSSDND